MLRNVGHSNPVGFDENSRLVLVDVTHPLFGAPELPDDQARETGRQVALWLLELLGPKTTVAKLCGLRFAFGLEHRSMDEVGRECGVSSAAISKFRVIYCKKFGLPAGKTEQHRAAFSHAQREVWRARHNGKEQK